MKFFHCSLFAATAIGLIFLSAPTRADQFVTQKSLIETFRSGGTIDMIRALNHVKQELYEADVLEVVQDVWDHDTSKYPGLRWNIIELDVIRINLADILIQANESGMLRIDQEPLHQFALGLLDRGDTVVVTQALTVLGTIDDPNDVPPIVRIAKRLQKYRFESAVASLAVMCSARASAALDQLQSELKYDGQNRYLKTLKKIRNGYSSYRNTGCH